MNFDQLIARGDDRNTWLGGDHDAGFACTGQKTEIGKADSPPPLQERLAFTGFGSTSQQTFVFAHGFENSNGVWRYPFRIFDHDDGVGAVRQRCTCHDFATFAPFHSDFGAGPSP